MGNNGIFHGDAPQFIIFSVIIAIVLYFLKSLETAYRQSLEYDLKLLDKTGYLYDLGAFGSAATVARFFIFTTLFLAFIRILVNHFYNGLHLFYFDFFILFGMFVVVYLQYLKYKYFLIRIKEERIGWLKKYNTDTSEEENNLQN